MFAEPQQQARVMQQQAVQPKLEIGAKDDPQEKEADAVAGKVMRMSDAGSGAADDEQKVRPMQDEDDGKVMKMHDDAGRKVMKMHDGGEASVQPMQDHSLIRPMRDETETVQEKEDEEETVRKKDDEEKVMMAGDANGGGGTATPAFQAQLNASKGSGSALPDHVQQDIGGKMGADLGDVRIHTDQSAHEMATGISAKAFTHGQDVYFKNGNYNPSSDSGKELLAHELAHTQQQKGGYLIQRQDDIKQTVEKKEQKNQKDSNKLNASDTLNSNATGVNNKTNLRKEVLPGKNSDTLVVQKENTLKGKEKDQKTDKEKETTGKTKKTESVDQKNKNQKNGKSKNQKNLKQQNNKKGPVTKSLTRKPANRPVKHKERPRKIDLKAELAIFKSEVQQIKTEADLLTADQSTQLKNAAAMARGTVYLAADDKRKALESAYDNAILTVTQNVSTTNREISDSYEYEKHRISWKQTEAPGLLEEGTTKRVKDLNTHGEEIAVSAEKYAVDEEKRVRTKENQYDKGLKEHVKQQIAINIRAYSAEGRRERMESNLGDMRQETIDAIRENNDDLIEEVKEDASDLAERIRGEYAEAAEKLTENKEPVIKSIDDLALQGQTELDTISKAPLDNFKTSGDTVLAQLNQQKAQTLAHHDGLVKKVTEEITADEQARSAELQSNLVNYKMQADQVTASLELNLVGLSDEKGYELITKASQVLNQSLTDFDGKTTALVAAKQGIYNETASRTVVMVDDLFNEAKSGTATTVTQFTTLCSDVKTSVTSSYTGVADKTTKGIADAVTQCLAAMDKSAADSVVAWKDEVAQGKADITEKVDGVQAKNDELYNDAKQEISDEADQLASEWEATYWTRQVLSVIGDIIVGILEVVAAIIAIVIAIILLVVAIIAIVALLVVLIAVIVEALAVIIAVLLEYGAAMLTFLVDGSIADLATWLYLSAQTWLAAELPIFMTALWASLAELAPFFRAWMIAEGIVGAGEWAYSFAPWLSDEEKKQLRIDGTFKIAFALLSEWEAVARIFKGPGYAPLPLTPEMKALEEQMARDVRIATEKEMQKLLEEQIALFMKNPEVQKIKENIIKYGLDKKYPFLSLEELTAIRYYTGPGAHDILNKMLRTGTLDGFNSAFANLLDSGLKKLLTKSGMVFRGCGPTESEMWLSKVKGDIVKLPDFTSTSTTMSEAQQFMYDRSGEVTLFIQDCEGAIIKDISMIPSEDEILLLRNAKFEIVESKQGFGAGDYTIVILKFLGFE